MKKILTSILALMTAGVLLSIAWSSNSDTLTLTTYPDPGTITVDTDSSTQFAVFPKITNASGAEVTEDYYLTYKWTLNDVEVSATNYYDFPANMEADKYTLKCAVLATRRSDNSVKTAFVTWYPKVDTTRNITLTVSDKVGTLAFTDTKTYSGLSIFDEICRGLNIKSEADLNKYTVSLTRTSSAAAKFSGAWECMLNNLGNNSLTISSTGTWSTQYKVSKNGTQVLSGTITVVVEPYVGVDAYFSAAPGQNVVIGKKTFTNFWSEQYGTKAELNSIYITGCTGLSGILCYDHTSDERSHSSSYGLTMYASPYSSFQKPLKDLTFVPSASANSTLTGTVTITFRAYGTDQDEKNVSIYGSIAIFYNASEPSAIAYSSIGSTIRLNGQDFDNVYRKTLGTTAETPIYSVRFLDLPAYGTLYHNYAPDGNVASGSIALTEGNLAIMTFSGSSGVENSLDNLTYVPTVSGGIQDSVRYLVYSGTQALYVGTIHFTSREFVVTYTTIEPVKFSSQDFYAGNSPLLDASSIVFDAPTSGILYKDYEGGIPVRSKDAFSFNAGYGVNALDDVTFVPEEDFTGTVEIPFSATSSLGSTIRGKVCIYVVAREVFEDVDPDGWAAPYINRLRTSEIVSGTSETTFSPGNDVTYGEALKMILLAAGYPPQEEPRDRHWASNYLLLAYLNEIVPDVSIDLKAPASRTAIAVMAAKALGLEQADSVDSRIVAPVDSTNGYVYALYNAGILNGSFENGLNYFHGDNNITRAEVAKIICKINDYTK